MLPPRRSRRGAHARSLVRSLSGIRNVAAKVGARPAVFFHFDSHLQARPFGFICIERARESVKSCSGLELASVAFLSLSRSLWSSLFFHSTGSGHTRAVVCKRRTDTRSSRLASRIISRRVETRTSPAEVRRVTVCQRERVIRIS